MVQPHVYIDIYFQLKKKIRMYSKEQGKKSNIWHFGEQKRYVLYLI